MQITVDFERSEAAALLRVLRRMLPDHIESAPREQLETTRDFGKASEKLRLALANALGPAGGLRLVRPRDENEGTLRMKPSGRWAVCRPGHAPVEITSGEPFRIEVDGELKLTRMEFRHFEGPLKGRGYRGQPGEYYSTDGYWLRDGLRAAIGSGE
jgi:hypothetical protein